MKNMYDLRKITIYSHKNVQKLPAKYLSINTCTQLITLFSRIHRVIKTLNEIKNYTAKFLRYDECRKNRVATRHVCLCFLTVIIDLKKSSTVLLVSICKTKRFRTSAMNKHVKSFYTI